MVWTYFCRDGYANNVGSNSRKKFVNYYIAPIFIWITKAAKLLVKVLEKLRLREKEGWKEWWKQKVTEMSNKETWDKMEINVVLLLLIPYISYNFTIIWVYRCIFCGPYWSRKTFKYVIFLFLFLLYRNILRFKIMNETCKIQQQVSSNHSHIKSKGLINFTASCYFSSSFLFNKIQEICLFNTPFHCTYPLQRKLQFQLHRAVVAKR